MTEMRPRIKRKMLWFIGANLLPDRIDIIADSFDRPFARIQSNARFVGDVSAEKMPVQR